MRGSFLPLVELLGAASLFAQVPRPDHVVVAILENHSYSQIIGSASAPYLNALAHDSSAAVFTQSFALTHPSQPNYLMLFSGSAQNVTDDAVPANLPFATPNLGAELLSKSLGFRAYSEDLPSVGFTGATSAQYARKHAPWVNWQGGGLNGLPASTHAPFDSFPSRYADLPAVAFVIPNLTHDIHDGTISQGDAWVHDRLDGYIQWAKSHNSLFVLTFDEDENAGGNNRITTIFCGAMVQGGSYAERITHYNVLRTVEDMYGLTHAGAADSATPIIDIWKSPTPVQRQRIRSKSGTHFNPGRFPIRGIAFSFSREMNGQPVVEFFAPDGTLRHSIR